MKFTEFWGLINQGEKRNITGWLAQAIRIASVIVVFYHVYNALFAPTDDILFRANHVAIFLVITIILYAPGQKGDKRITLPDIMLVLLAIATAVYVQLNAERFLSRWTGSDPVYLLDIIFGVILMLLILETSRRVMGLSLTVIVFALVAYAFVGPWIPGLFGHRGFSLARIVEMNYLTTNGIFGITTKVSSTFAFIFIIFGAFLKLTGGGDFFFDIAQRVAGFTRGGIAKTAVIASALFGSLSGSSIANASSTGSITIPMMKKSGYPPSFAAAVETAASCGGPIMPPVMGSTAFIMAEILGIPFFQIVAIAFMPAVIYFASIFIQIDSESIRLNLKGIPRKDLPSMARIWAGVLHYFIPLGWLVYRLYEGYTPSRVGMETIIMLLIFTLIRRRGKLTIREIVDAFVDSVRSNVAITVACAAGGIIVGVISLTGIGSKFTTLIMNFGQDMAFFSLLLTMFVSIILGLAMNVTPTYILTAALAGPALIKMGLPAISVHLFMVYFASMGALTPPVALTAFTAASIAGANPMEVGWKGWRLAIAAFAVPFSFIYRPSLLYFDNPVATLEAVVFTCLAVYALVGGVDGFLLGLKGVLPRFVLLADFVFLMVPNLSLNVPALVLLVILILWGRWSKRREAAMPIIGG